MTYDNFVHGEEIFNNTWGNTLKLKTYCKVKTCILVLQNTPTGLSVPLCQFYEILPCFTDIGFCTVFFSKTKRF